jgi:transcriptional regulator with XRE-family HTH domain
LPQSFAVKLEFVLKALSMSRGDLATALGVDKSLAGRWARGTVKPSAHNLARLTSLIASRVEGFSILDWERDLERLAGVVGVDPDTVGGVHRMRIDHPLLDLVLGQALDGTARRGAAYEGFFRSTRPYPRLAGRFMRDHILVRRDAHGLLRFKLGSEGVIVAGWVLPQQHQLFLVGAESATGALAFAIFNGVNARRADFIEGLLLSCSLDVGRTPTACAMVIERIGDLTDDAEADDRRFDELTALEPLAPDGSVPRRLRDHLARDIGPAQAAIGGDWLLRLPIARALTP